jgi:hypothetical protein
MVKQPLYTPLWTISHGGANSATTPLTLTLRLDSTTTTVSCADGGCQD